MPRTTKQFKDMRTERRVSILEAALHVFAEEGYHSASISKLSKYAKISKGLLYNYFESKEELLKILLVPKRYFAKLKNKSGDQQLLKKRGDTEKPYE